MLQLMHCGLYCENNPMLDAQLFGVVKVLSDVRNKWEAVKRV